MNWHLILIDIFFIYCSYRVGQKFELTPFAFNQNIKLFDLIILFDLLYVLILVALFVKDVFWHQPKPIVQNGEGFAVDESILIDPANDILKRNRFIEELRNKLKATKTQNGSFPIGIVAKWGSGKSTFINSLVNGLDQKDFVVIELNVWKYASSAQIIEGLFEQLKSKLHQYSFKIENKLQQYSNSLLKGAQGDEISILRNILSVFSTERSLEQQYEYINSELKKLPIKIVIVIDDLDRLDKKEIYEVIRLIRNTANFSNTFFIVAYDRNYLLNAIEEINPYEAHTYLEKIFQLEFTLPPISAELIREQLWQRLSAFLTENDKIGYREMIENGSQFYEENYRADLTSMFLSNIRDVVRFTNSFRLNYEFIKDEIFFPDFFNLELIRFKHPELYTELYYDSERILTIEDPRDSNGFENLMYYTLSSKKTDNTLNLRTYLEELKIDYKLSKQEIDKLCNALNSIFPGPDQILEPRKKINNFHLTVIKPSMFERYFILSVQGKLSEIEFSKMRQFPFNQLIEKINEIINDEELITGLSERFKAMKDFDNREDFEKMSLSMLYFAGRQHPEKYNGAYIGLDMKKFAALITDDKIAALYKDPLDYKNFLKDLLKTYEIEYSYRNDFTYSALRVLFSYFKRQLKHTEIQDIQLENFRNSFLKQSTLNLDTLTFFHATEKQIYSASSQEIMFIKNPIAVRMMRRLILNGNMDEFIKNSVDELLFENTFKINELPSQIFKSNEFFVCVLKKYKGPSKYRLEFIQLYELMKKDLNYTRGVPPSFFKEIPITVRTRN